MIRLKKLAVVFVLCLGFFNCGSINSTLEAQAPNPAGSANVDLAKGAYPPHDLKPGLDPAKPADLAQFEYFAWQSFIALNWPAASNARGVPDPSRSFANSGDPNFYASGGRLVWETYPHKVEIFPGRGTPSSTLNNPPKYVYGVNVTVPPGVDSTLYNNLDEGTQIGQNYIIFPANPPNPSRNPNDDYQILFEAKANRVEYDYVFQNKYYDTGISGPAAANTVAYLSNPAGGRKSPYIDFPAGDMSKPPPSSGPDLNEGVIEVKAAWRPLTQAQINSGRYHTAKAIYYTGTDDAPTMNNATFGLVGLHIIHKTKNYPYFIFATFEQVDALMEPQTGNPTGLYYITTYDYLQYQDNNGNPTSKPAYPPQLPPSGYQSPHLPPHNAGPYTAAQFTRTQPITPAVNAAVHAAIKAQNPKSVWQYYKLLGVQAVPTNTKPSPGDPTSSPYYYLANIVIETSPPGVSLFSGRLVAVDTVNSVPPFPAGFAVQPENFNIYTVQGSTSKTVNTGGCQGCHGNAQIAGYDFSFILQGGPVPNPDVKGLQTGETISKRHNNQGARAAAK